MRGLSSMPIGFPGLFGGLEFDPNPIAIPFGGSGVYWYGGQLVNTPIMVYHGDCDEVVPIGDSIEMLKSVNKRGGHAEIRICYGLGHNAWDIAYKGDELANWLLSHKKAN